MESTAFAVGLTDLLHQGLTGCGAGLGSNSQPSHSVSSVVPKSPALGHVELIENKIPSPHLGATYHPQLWNQPLRICTFKNALSILSKCITNVDKNSLLCICVAIYINRFRAFFGSLFLKFNLH